MSDKEQVEPTPFDRWFEGSKMVDDNGQPLVVYHGTRTEFSIFEVGRASKNYSFKEYETSRKGVFFTANKAFANEFSGKNGWVISAYLSIQKPLDLSDGYPYDFYIKHLDMLCENNLSRMHPNEMWEMLDDGFPGSEEFVAAVKADGYDGLLMVERDTSGSENDVYVVFDPAQIKSATQNNGEYGPQNPDIRFSVPDSPGVEDDEDEDEEAPRRERQRTG